MRSTTLTALAAAALSVPALALATGSGADLGDRDLDGDGVLSIQEMQTEWPRLAPEDFMTLDENGDGFLDAEEFAAAEESALLPAPGEPSPAAAPVETPEEPENPEAAAAAAGAEGAGSPLDNTGSAADRAAPGAAGEDAASDAPGAAEEEELPKG